MAISILPNIAESVPSSVATLEENKLTTKRLITPMTSERETFEFEKKHYLKPYPSIVAGSGSFFGDGPLQSREYPGKIESTGFPFNNPWLPKTALRLLNRLEKGPISEIKLVELMKLIAERSSIHFQLSEGKFVAMTFAGRIVEASETRIGLLKKIQGQRYREQIFVWKVGSDAFSGRL